MVREGIFRQGVDALHLIQGHFLWDECHAIDLLELFGLVTWPFLSTISVLQDRPGWEGRQTETKAFPAQGAGSPDSAFARTSLSA